MSSLKQEGKSLERVVSQEGSSTNNIKQVSLNIDDNLILQSTDDTYHAMKSLMSQCVIIAIDDLKRYHDPAVSKENRTVMNYRSARFWITRPDNYGLYSFIQCCTILNIDPHVIRNELKKKNYLTD